MSSSMCYSSYILHVLLPRSRLQVTSPYNIHALSSKLTGNENAQMYQVEIVVLI